MSFNSNPLNQAAEDCFSKKINQNNHLDLFLNSNTFFKKHRCRSVLD